MTKTVNGAPITMVSRGYRIIPAVSITMQTSSRHSHEYMNTSFGWRRRPLETYVLRQFRQQANVTAVSQTSQRFLQTMKEQIASTYILQKVGSKDRGSKSFILAAGTNHNIIISWKHQTI